MHLAYVLFLKIDHLFDLDMGSNISTSLGRNYHLIGLIKSCNLQEWMESNLDIGLVLAHDNNEGKKSAITYEVTVSHYFLVFDGLKIVD